MHLFICFYQLCTLADGGGMILEQRSRLAEAKAGKYEAIDVLITEERTHRSLFPSLKGIQGSFFISVCGSYLRAHLLL